MKNQPIIEQPVDLSKEKDIEQRLQKARTQWNPLILWVIFMILIVIIGIVLIYLREKGILAL